MKRLFTFLCMLALVCGCVRTPKADYVILLGFDAMSARGLQRAETPNFNYMIENGAVSLHTRCVRETSSSQNWMSMVSASPIEMHTVYSNKWKPGQPGNVDPALHNNIGLYPTIFDHIREQRPDVTQYGYIEWAGEVRMYDPQAFDRLRICGRDSLLHDYHDVIRTAFSEYLEDRPEFMFLSLDITDARGHGFGHESDEYLSCISEMDGYVGDFVRELEKRGWMKNTVIIVTADHGGISYGHGGDSLEEYEIPVIVFGKGVSRGKIMHHTNMIYDVGATVAGLLGVELPWECHGKLITEAFEPADKDEVYVPMPFVRPFRGKAAEGVSISVNDPDAQIRYTLDGSEPGPDSPLYEGPFKLERTSTLRAAAFKEGQKSAETVHYLFPDSNEPPIAFKLYKNVMESFIPDFTKFGLPYDTGYVNEFALDEFDLAAEDHFAILFASTLIVPEEATYGFELQSDDGSRLYLDGQLLIDNSHGRSTTICHASKKLGAGRHLLKLEYYEHSSTQSLRLYHNVNGGPYIPINPEMLDR